MKDSHDQIRHDKIQKALRQGVESRVRLVLETEAFSAFRGKILVNMIFLQLTCVLSRSVMKPFDDIEIQPTEEHCAIRSRGVLFAPCG
jgi:hypothetical protein